MRKKPIGKIVKRKWDANKIGKEGTDGKFGINKILWKIGPKDRVFSNPPAGFGLGCRRWAE
jgi:hypothetical protein